MSYGKWQVFTESCEEKNENSASAGRSAADAAEDKRGSACHVTIASAVC